MLVVRVVLEGREDLLHGLVHLAALAVLEGIREFAGLHFVKVVLHVHPHAVVRVAVVFIVALEVVHEVLEEELGVVARKIWNFVGPVLRDAYQRV